MLPSVLQNLGFAAGSVSAPVTPPKHPTYPSTTGAGGNYGRAWTPDKLYKPDEVRRYKKTKDDEELERLLKEAIKREDLAKQARKIADVAKDKVTSVQDIARAAQNVEKEILSLSSRTRDKLRSERLRKLKEEEDLIITLLLMDI